MDYLVTFLEGVITFISPCLLPMLPIYIAYFAGEAGQGVQLHDGQPRSIVRTLVDALGFVAGFTIVFTCLGALAASLGSFVAQHRTVLDIVCGVIVIVFGLHFSGLLHIPLLDRTAGPQARFAPTSFLSAVAFGMVFSIGWTPCVGAFLGSALLLAATAGSVAHGVGLLVAFCAGLGIPFVLCAVAVEQLGAAFDAIKRHYRIVNRVCGLFLVVVGVLMAFGLFDVWLSLLSS